MTNKKELQNEILKWLGDKVVDIQELTDFIHDLLGCKYEFGDAGYVINAMLSDGILQIVDADRITKGNK